MVSLQFISIKVFNTLNLYFLVLTNRPQLVALCFVLSMQIFLPGMQPEMECNFSDWVKELSLCLCFSPLYALILNNLYLSGSIKI